MSVTSVEIVHMCSCHARIITWRDHARVSFKFAHVFSSPWKLFYFNEFFFYEYLETCFPQFFLSISLQFFPGMNKTKSRNSEGKVGVQKPTKYFS